MWKGQAKEREGKLVIYGRAILRSFRTPRAPEMRGRASAGPKTRKQKENEREKKKCLEGG